MKEFEGAITMEYIVGMLLEAAHSSKEMKNASSKDFE